MRAYILTGTPGSGKTAILRQLEVNGHRVIEEAATAVNALSHAQGHREPWRDNDFIDRIVTLQRQRQDTIQTHGTVFFDRSPVCTLALSRYLGYPPTPALIREVERAETGYQKTVFFVRNQGFVEPTAARRISFEDSLVFEDVHERAYRELGFELVDVPPGPLAERVALIESKADNGLTEAANPLSCNNSIFWERSQKSFTLSCQDPGWEGSGDVRSGDW